ncbi:MAG: preprotein translocase subunit SecG [Candidatus Omnitrophota bacterium]
MYILLIILHIIVCLVLISVILLQAGRGGGLTEAAGGGETAQSVLGTQAPVILKKATTVSAIVFLVTSLVLGMVTARRGMSLFEDVKLPPLTAAIPQESEEAGNPEDTGSVPTETAPITGEKAGSPLPETE